MKVGVFADGLWGLKFIKILNLDKNFFLDFVVLRKKFDNKILQFCKNKKIKYFVFDNINKKKNIQIIKKFKSDIYVSMSYNQIFKNNFFKLIKKQLINCHAGALPYYRGRSPINWAIINGEKKIGITTHLVNLKIDNGDILDQKFINIKNSDNFKTILKKCYIICPMQLYKVLKKIKNKSIKTIKQSSISKKGSYYFKRKEGDEVINFDNNYKDLNNFVRGLIFPSIGATFFYNQKSYKVMESHFVKKIDNNKNLNGIILKVTKKKLNIKISNSIIFFKGIFSKRNTLIQDLRKIFKKNSFLAGTNV